jgi:hypothetical protein
MMTAGRARGRGLVTVTGPPTGRLIQVNLARAIGTVNRMPIPVRSLRFPGLSPQTRVMIRVPAAAIIPTRGRRRAAQFMLRISENRTV